jgi:hypothetical protein
MQSRNKKTPSDSSAVSPRMVTATYVQVAKAEPTSLTQPPGAPPGGFCARSSSLYLDSGIPMRCRSGVDPSRKVRPTHVECEADPGVTAGPPDSTAAEQQALAALNASWDALPDRAAASGWFRGRLRTLPLTVD